MSSGASLIVRVVGREYSVMCESDSVDELNHAADELNRRMEEVKATSGSQFVSQETVAVLVALNLQAEIGRSRKGGSKPGRSHDRIQLLLDDFTDWVKERTPDSPAIKTYLSILDSEQ